jgi:hypothetical protein
MASRLKSRRTWVVTAFRGPVFLWYVTPYPCGMLMGHCGHYEVKVGGTLTLSDFFVGGLQ